MTYVATFLRRVEGFGYTGDATLTPLRSERTMLNADYSTRKVGR